MYATSSWQQEGCGGFKPKLVGPGLWASRIAALEDRPVGLEETPKRSAPQMKYSSSERLLNKRFSSEVHRGWVTTPHSVGQPFMGCLFRQGINPCPTNTRNSLCQHHNQPGHKPTPRQKYRRAAPCGLPHTIRQGINPPAIARSVHQSAMPGGHERAGPCPTILLHAGMDVSVMPAQQRRATLYGLPNTQSGKG